jgi:hypothetical protein
MPELSRRYIALIGDVVGSRQIRERIPFDDRLLTRINDLGDRNPYVVSRYTLIGDEVQAVFRGAGRLFRDAISVTAAIHPVKMRFSYGVGSLTKPINPDQAIEMDGPAFHRARDGVNELKETGHLFTVVGDDVPQVELVRTVLRLVSHHMERWNKNRLEALAGRLEGAPVKEIAEQLRLSDQAIYKTIDAGAIDVIIRLFDCIEEAMDEGLSGQI